MDIRECWQPEKLFEMLGRGVRFNGGDKKRVSPIFHAFKFSSGSIGLNVGMYGA